MAWIVTDQFAIGFMSPDMLSIVDHAGERMGAAELITSWRINAFERMYQVESVIDARRYTGRTLGANRLWRGRVKKVQFAARDEGKARRMVRRAVRTAKLGV